ncbi:hypothetical protein [Providencia sp. PROV261]|nr:hypothetical protein [Providencia sp. PROV261]AIN64708.1 hypothetical protein DR96_2591 [Providencia stuartii]SST02684.1 Uncharacterised protein [Acinetobacter baumannii]CAK6614236.1 Transposase [Providencia stuartii]CAK6615485.1 Transposase [Providencia stuartii]SPY65194.1 Uncharacterised protein [Providencia stuartii]
MKKAHFTETQIINILKLAGSGMKVEDICRHWSAVLVQVLTRQRNDDHF